MRKALLDASVNIAASLVPFEPGQREHPDFPGPFTPRHEILPPLGQKKGDRAIRSDKPAAPGRTPPVINLLARHPKTARNIRNNRARLKRRQNNGLFLSGAPTAATLDRTKIVAAHQPPHHRSGRL